MSITKIHAIKATIQKAVDYICDRDKTDGSILISSYATSPEFAAEEFRFSLDHTHQRDPNLAYHLIQSFAPGEVTPELAHEIGKELADRHLQGKHSYIIATHVDKGHVHNHIIFCAAENFEAKKYHSCGPSYRDIRNINDALCREHNLSVVEQKTGPAKTYKEWQSEKSNMSWKTKLRKDINATIKESGSYEEFISLMKAKGYEIKDYEISEEAHKYIGFRAPGQERWIRGREQSLGEDFTKEKIKERIEKSVQQRAERKKKPYHPTELIDTSGEKFAESPGLKKWVERENLQLAAKIQSELSGRGFKSLQDVDDKIRSLHTQAVTAKRTTVALDKRKKASAEVLTYARQYSEKKRYLQAYKKSKDPDRYYREHSYDLHLAWGAEDILKANGIDPETMKLKDIESEYRQICSDRDKTYAEYRSAEKECAELTGYRDTLLQYIGESKEQAITEPEKDKNRDR